MILSLRAESPARGIAIGFQLWNKAHWPGRLTQAHFERQQASAKLTLQVIFHFQEKADAKRKKKGRKRHSFSDVAS